MSVVFVDTETTGLNPLHHEVWEAALIDGTSEYVFHLEIDLTKAESTALRISGYYERFGQEAVFPLADAAERIAHLTANKHLVGTVPSFDAAFLARLLHKNGFRDAWHYHLIDVEALAVGWLSAQVEPALIDLPWDSAELSRSVGVNPDDFDKHTALGDARWAKAIYEAVTK